jgi:hypothetical protein
MVLLLGLHSINLYIMTYFIFATFDLSKFNKEKNFDFVLQNLFFVPEWITSTQTYDDGDFYLPESTAHLQENENFSIFDKKLENDFPDNNIVVVFNPWENFLSISWSSTTLYDSDFVKKIFDFMSSAEGLINCVYYNSDDVSWESEIFESNYEVFGKPIDSLKFIEDENLGKIIDTSQNYGRCTIVRGFQAVAAPEMIFGIEAKKYISFDILKQISFAEKTIEYINGFIYIKLFDINVDPSEPSIRKTQKMFWEQLNLREIEFSK